MKVQIFSCFFNSHPYNTIFIEWYLGKHYHYVFSKSSKLSNLTILRKSVPTKSACSPNWKSCSHQWAHFSLLWVIAFTAEFSSQTGSRQQTLLCSNFWFGQWQDVHDRALLYYRLLQQGVEIAERVVNPTKQAVSVFADTQSSEIKDRIFDEFNSLSVLYQEVL